MSYKKKRKLQIKNRELKEKNIQIQTTNRIKDEFLSSISHDLRTPLNGIIGFSELLLNAKLGSLSSTQKKYVNNILSSAYHLLLLINDIFDLSKIESGSEWRDDKKISWNRVRFSANTTHRGSAKRSSRCKKRT